MQFANAFAYNPENENRNSPPPYNHQRYVITPPGSPQPHGGAGAPAPLTNVERARLLEIRRQMEQARLNEQLQQLRAIVPNAYEENGIMIIPAAGRRFAAPARVAGAVPAPVQQRQFPAASLPPIRPAAPEPAPEDPSLVNNSNNENVNPRPRRSPRRRTRRHRSRKNSRRSRR